MVIVGENEEKDGTVSVRRHGNINDGTMPLEGFVTLINTAIKAELDK